MKGRKAPGLDGVTGSMVKEVFKTGNKLRKCLCEGRFAVQCKTAKVITLLKSPDIPKDLTKSYRSICLLPAWSKVLEHIMMARLKEDCGRNIARSCDQYGFTHNKSTVDVWLEMKE